MQKKTIIILLIVPLIIAGIFYFLDTTDILTPGRYSLGAAGSQEDMLIVIPVGLCGLFFTLFMVPILFRNSFINWKSNNSSWKWELPLVLATFLIGTLMTMGTGYLVLLLLPLDIIVFGICLLVTLIFAGKTNIKSSFFLINLLFIILPILGFIIVNYIFRNCCH